MTVYNSVYDETITETTETPSSPSSAPAAEPVASPLSAAVEKFRSCRWRRPAEDGEPECCGHRDVLPITGVHGFDAEAWCPECQLYKLRRTPKKREDFTDRYRY